VHGKRGRRVEYSIGWPVDERTQAAIAQLREEDWTVALDAQGDPDPDAAVSDLTGILRHGPGGDRMANWPADVRVMVTVRCESTGMHLPCQSDHDRRRAARPTRFPRAVTTR
jgi:hypothetical protein